MSEVIAPVAPTVEAVPLVGTPGRKPLTLRDVCDQCPAGAAVRVTRQLDAPKDSKDYNLIFCEHHYNDLAADLLVDGFEVTGDLRKPCNCYQCSPTKD